MRTQLALLVGWTQFSTQISKEADLSTTNIELGAHTMFTYKWQSICIKIEISLLVAIYFSVISTTAATTATVGGGDDDYDASYDLNVQLASTNNSEISSSHLTDKFVAAHTNKLVSRVD